MISKMFSYCVVPEIVHTLGMEGHWKFLGGVGECLKAKLLEEKYEAKLEFPGGLRGCKTKINLPWGRTDIFWNYT